MPFVLHNTSHVYYIQEVDVVCRRRYGCAIYAQCDVPIVGEDEHTIFLAVTLIQKTYQAAWFRGLHPALGSLRDKVLGPNDPDGEEQHIFMNTQLFKDIICFIWSIYDQMLLHT